MGLRDIEAGAIERAATWYGRDWLRRALKGEKGPDVQQLALWIMANKGPLGSFLVLLGGMFGAGVAQGVFHGQGFVVGAFVLSYFGAYIAGSGQIKSDAYYKPQLADLKAAKALDRAEGPPA